MGNKTIDILDIIKLLKQKDINYLTIERKHNSLYGNDIEFSSIYILGYKKEDYNKTNYEYSFYLYKLDLQVDKYLFKQILKEKTERLILGDTEKIIKAFDKRGIGKIDENDVEVIKKGLKEKRDHENIYLEMIYSHMQIINIGDNGEDVKKEVILKKKTEEKIIKTYGNAIFHSVLYNKDEKLDCDDELLLDF